MKEKPKVVIIDTSALLSGKPIHIENAEMLTTPAVAAELKPGGRDYRTFQLLQEKGLLIESPSQESLQKIKKTAEQTGDIQRVSPADIEILALALDIKKAGDREPILLTDDYSIQNVADAAQIPFQSFSQQGITKRFKWFCRCPGCGKQFREPVKICPVCGTETKAVCHRKQALKRSK